MSTTPVKTISKTEASADALKFAHRWIFKRVEIYPEQWTVLLMQLGYQFAALFSSLFPGQEQQIEKALTQTPPAPGEPNNWFWMWWRLKFMQDDWEYIDQKVYCQPLSYEQYKTYMLNCEHLEQELLHLIKSKSIL